MDTKTQEEKLETIKYVVESMMPNLPYHNFAHAMDVYYAVDRLASLAGIDYENRFLLKTAGLVHDGIFIPGNKENEELTSEFIVKYLPKIGYTYEQAQKVGQLILPTKMPQNPKNHLEKLLCDADLDNLGRTDFFEKGNKLRIELGATEGKQWYRQQFNFLRSHKYHTEAARKLRDKQKSENLKILEAIILC